MIWELVQVFALFSGMLLASGAGAPIPEELTLVLAGLWCGGHPEFDPLRWLLLPICIFSSVLADSVLFFTGRYYGERVHKGQFRLLGLTPKSRGNMEGLFHRWGISLLVAGRLIPVFRLPLFLTAGLMRMPVSKFAVADLIGAGITNSLFFLLACWMGDKFKEDLEFFLKNLRPVLWVLVGLSILAWGAWAIWKLSKKGKEDLDGEGDSALSQEMRPVHPITGSTVSGPSGQAPVVAAHSLKETG